MWWRRREESVKSLPSRRVALAVLATLVASRLVDLLALELEGDGRGAVGVVLGRHIEGLDGRVREDVDAGLDEVVEQALHDGAQDDASVLRPLDLFPGQQLDVLDSFEEVVCCRSELLEEELKS